MENGKKSTQIIVLEKRSLRQRLVSVFYRITYNHLFAFGVICLTGWLFISLSYNFPAFNDAAKTEENFMHLFLRDIGIGLFPLGIIALVYEVLLRNNAMNNMTITIKELMPGRYTHLRESGLIDVYPNLQLDKLMDDFRKLKNAEIRITDIWMENFNRIEKALIKAVLENNCKVKIMLWNPMCTDAVENRARALGDGYSLRRILTSMMGNLAELDNMLKKIENHPNAGNFEVKLYSSFIATSYISFGEECLVGFYLREHISSMGTQIKIVGRNHYFFKELDDHFISQWEDKEQNSTVVFDRNKYRELTAWFDKFLHDGLSNAA